MLFFILIFSLIQLKPEGALVDTFNPPQCHCESIDLHARENQTNTGSHLGMREQNEIIVSCLATIFACTWTTIHPNIPAPNESGWDSLKRRVVTMVYALLAPEAITAWAMRQYFSAKRIANRYNSYFVKEIKRPPQKQNLTATIRQHVKEWIHGSPLPEELKQGEIRPWTITHGFFLQMGGFMLSNGGRPISTYKLFRFGIQEDIKNGVIDAPTTTESDIRDRSKGDMLSKTVVILQTTWFIVQCIARWSTHLPVTELEIVTLGFAMLNALTYAFWWHKPQSVGISIYLQRKTQVGQEGRSSLGEERHQMPESTDQSSAGEVTTSLTDMVVPGEEVAEDERETDWNTTWNAAREIWLRIKKIRTAKVLREEIPIYYRSFFVRQLEDDKKHSLWQLCWRAPYALVLAILHPLAKLLQFSPTEKGKWDLRVPMFNMYGIENETVFIASSFIAFMFGLIHFIPGWFLDFPSRPEKILWRISAGIITAQPIILGIWSKWKKGIIGAMEAFYGSPSPLLNAVALAGVPLYVVARFTLIILAFVSLRDLSHTALVSIDWISFVPHI